VVAVVLGVLSAVSYGVADFSGGLASRSAHVLRVLAFSAPASLLVELAVLPALPGHWSAAAVGWGAGAGMCSAAAFLLLYQSLAIGPMSVLSPITAVVSAALPVLVGAVQGERLTSMNWSGVVLAGAAIILVSTTGGSEGPRASAVSVALAGGAGAAIAGQLILLDQTPHDSGVVPLLTGRAVTGTAALLAFGLAQAQLGTARPNARLAVLAGALDAVANLAFLLAVRHGDLITVAVITALYPAATVLLARTILQERLAPNQIFGLAAAVTGIVLLTA
jgi:drug/metabolite transporter (DMT)-like permease